MAGVVLSVLWMNEIMVHCEQRNRMRVVFDLLGEAVCQPGKAARKPATLQTVSLDRARRTRTSKSNTRSFISAGRND
jgi:hypothetical protein